MSRQSRKPPRQEPASRPLVEAVLDKYLTSHDFNGLPWRDVFTDPEATWTPEEVVQLVQSGDITVEFGDRHPNPHIKAFDEETPAVTAEKIGKRGLDQACLYPGRDLLAKRVDRSQHAGRPYDLELALGAGQLSVRYFDLIVLESYRSDPRFHYDCNDVGGRFSPTDEACQPGGLLERDQVFISHFGFGYNNDLNRSVAAFLRDLSVLRPEHQQLWRARELEAAGWFPHPGWWAAMMGHWPQNVPLFEAFMAELRVANDMCDAIGWPRIFLEDFANRTPSTDPATWGPEDLRERKRPKEFAFLLRPTLASFNGFVHLLDKLMSDNLAHEFFTHQGLSVECEVLRSGKAIVERKGTIRLLEEWFKTRFSAADPTPLDKSIVIFKEVRRERQRPAHALDEDRFDNAFFKRQRELMIRAYGAVRVIRLVLSNHPLAQGVDVPDWLDKGEIWPF